METLPQVLTVDLTEDNFLIFAQTHYDSVFDDDEEFFEDLKRFVYLKRLFNSYVNKGELKERLILNHLVILYNVFGPNATPMLFLKLKGYESILKTFLCFMERMPDAIHWSDPELPTINNTLIPLDLTIWERISKI